MESGANDLLISQSGAGQLYYTINSRVYQAQTVIDPAGVVEVSRAYFDGETGKKLETAVAGQLVEVQLTVTMPEQASYIIVEDNLPGGLEALNERLNTSSHEGALYDWDDPVYYWQDYGYNHKEIRGDQVSFFITDFERGKRTITYMTRATHNGRFTAMPAEVYAMYDLSTWGRSASDGFIIFRLIPSLQVDNKQKNPCPI